MRNKLIIIISIIMLTTLNVFLILKKDNNIVEKNKVIKIERKEFNIYLQQTVGSEDYNPSSSETFPNQGYLLNEEKTECYGYNNKPIEYKPTQNLVNEVIDGSITIESSNTIYCNLYFDKDETPIITTFNVKGKTSSNQELNNGFSYQTDSLPFTVEYTDTEEDVKQYCINETEGSDNCNWYPLAESNSYSLKDTKDGLKTLHIYLKDKANNISEVKQDTITVDKTKPVINTFTLTGTKASEDYALTDGYTHTKDITYNANITEDNIESYCIYEDSNSCNYINNTSITITNQNYTLTNETEGDHTVNLKVKDKAGNESEVNTNSTKIITLDTQNPTEVNIIEEIIKSTSIQILINGTDTLGVKSKQCRKAGENWITANDEGSCTISTGLSAGKQYTIEAMVIDNSGRYDYKSKDITTKPEYYCLEGVLTLDPSKENSTEGYICVKDGENKGPERVCSWVCGTALSQVGFGYTSWRSCEAGRKKTPCADDECYWIEEINEYRYDQTGSYQCEDQDKYVCPMDWVSYSSDNRKCYKPAIKDD